jgi:hypothetical protein
MKLLATIQGALLKKTQQSSASSQGRKVLYKAVANHNDTPRCDNDCHKQRGFLEFGQYHATRDFEVGVLDIRREAGV